VIGSAAAGDAAIVGLGLATTTLGEGDAVIVGLGLTTTTLGEGDAATVGLGLTTTTSGLFGSSLLQAAINPTSSPKTLTLPNQTEPATEFFIYFIGIESLTLTKLFYTISTDFFFGCLSSP
jgi:hypothetical protein